MIRSIRKSAKCKHIKELAPKKESTASAKRIQGVQGLDDREQFHASGRISPEYFAGTIPRKPSRISLVSGYVCETRNSGSDCHCHIMHTCYQ